MKSTSIVSFLVLSLGALAQSDFTSRLPNCALKCLVAALPTSDCSSSDLGCLCADTAFVNTVAGCNSLNCTVVEVLQATNETFAACGVPTRNQADKLIGVTASFGALAVVMVAIRLIDRAISAQAQLGWDDLLIGLSGIVSFGMNIPVIVSGTLGFGKDIWGIPADNITLSLKYLYVAYFMYMLAEGLCQLSLLAFYLRIMVNKKSRMTVWVLVGIVSAFCAANVFSMIFQCQPISYFWDGWKLESPGKCMNVQLFGFVRGGIEIFLDLAILSMPLPMLYGLKMSKKKKLQIMSMFCVGFVITVVSCLRLYSFVTFANSTNPTYDNVPGLYWCATESNLFTVVACMPAVHGVIHKGLRRVRGEPSTYASRGQYGSDGPSKGYLRHNGSDGRSRSGSLPFGVISKNTEVNVYRTDRSSSDIELVNDPSSK